MSLAMNTEVEPLSAVVARRVRGLMAELRVNQVDLALALGVSRTAVSDRLRGVKPVNLDEVPLLARLLRTSPEYLLGLTDDRTVGADRWAPWDSNPQPADYWPAGLRLVADVDVDELLADVVELDGARSRRRAS